MPPHQENEGFRGCVGEDHICHEGRKEHWERAAGEQCEESDQRGLLSKQPETGRRPQANCQVIPLIAGNHHLNRGNRESNRALKTSDLFQFQMAWRCWRRSGRSAIRHEAEKWFLIFSYTQMVMFGLKVIQVNRAFSFKIKQHHMVLVYKKTPCHSCIWKC